jgi:hypothetical protein
VIECLAFLDVVNLAMCTFGTHTFVCNNVAEVLFGPEVSRATRHARHKVTPAVRAWLVDSLYTWADQSARDAAREEQEQIQALEAAILDGTELALQFDEMMLADWG